MPAPIPDYLKVSLLLPMNGANNGTTFTDYSPTPKTVTRAGGAVTSTAQSKYYGSSGFFDGTGDALSSASHADFALGTGDFTIGMWVRKTSGDAQTYQRLLQIGSDSGGGQVTILANAGTANEFRPYVAGYSGTAITIVEPGASPSTQDAWNHLEVVRSGSDWFVWVNGSLSSQSTLAGYSIVQAAVYVGSNNAGVQEFAGYLQDLYIMKGIALHTATFTPPARLIGDIVIETRDQTGALSPRKVFAVRRSEHNKIVASGTTNGSGAMTMTGLPACEYSVVAIAEGDALPDLILRKTPA